MALFMSKIKSMNRKKALSVVILAGLVALLVSSPFASAQAVFNTFPISYTGGDNVDLPMIDARVFPSGSYSASQTDHDNGVNVNAGDVVMVSVYFHNGQPDAPEHIAHNTIIQAFLSPSLGNASQTHTVSASIRADGVSPVVSAQKGGDMKIHVQGANPQALSLVSGSVTVTRDASGTGNQTTQALPDTIFASGVNIGDVRGCFNFSGFVNFKLHVANAAPGNISIQKNVRATTAGSFVPDQVNAIPSQTVEYQILVTASNSAVQNVRVKDALDPRLSLNGQVSIINETTLSSSEFFAGGVNIGTINANQTKEIRFQAILAPSSQFPVGTHTLTNVATAFTDSQTVADGANVLVVIAPQQIVCVLTWDAPVLTDGSQRGLRKTGELYNVRQQITGLNAGTNFNVVFQHVSGTPNIKFLHSSGAGNFDEKEISAISSIQTGDYNAFVEVNNVNVATCRGFRIEPQTVVQIDLNKLVRNETFGGSFTDSISNVAPGSRLTFQLTVNTTGSNANLTNVFLSDLLPSKLNFLAGSLNINGTASSANLASINLGVLSPNTTVAITFQADVAGVANFVVGCEVLTNSATVTASGNLSDTDTATVQVCKNAPTKQPGTPGLRPQ